MFFGGGFRLGKIFGIEINIDYSWFIIFFLVTWSLAFGLFPFAFPQLGVTLNFILGVITSVLFFVSALIHEIAHSLMARASGVAINKITLFLFGGAAQLTDEPPSAGAEFKMAIVGPLSSLALAIIFGLLAFGANFQNIGLPFVAVTSTLAVINFWLGIFNLLPGYPLDGGRVLRAIIWHYNKNLERATRYASYAGDLLAAILVVIGVYELIVGGFVGGLWLILIGFFLFQAAESSYRQVKVREELEEAEVKDLMSDQAIQVSPAMSVEELVNNYFWRSKSRSLPVVEGEEMLGIVKLEDVEKHPQRNWQDLKVQDVMVREVQEVSPSEKASAAFRKINHSGEDRLPVVKEKRFLGFISLNDISYYLTLKKKKRLSR
jgi:Zn-dependent protease